MLSNMVRQENVLYIMGAVLALGVVAKIVSAMTARRMVKAAGEIQKSNHRLMKLVKAKFEHASMISDKVQNVEAFVDKHLYEYKVLGISLYKWISFPKKIIWIIGILGVFAVFESYRIAGFGDLFLTYVQWTSIFLMLLFLLCFVMEERSLIQATRTYIVEYLENVCVHRYEKMHREVQNQEEEKEEVVNEQEEEEELQIAEQLEEERKKSEQEMRIRAILEEFLVD